MRAQVEIVPFDDVVKALSGENWANPGGETPLSRTCSTVSSTCVFPFDPSGMRFLHSTRVSAVTWSGSSFVRPMCSRRTRRREPRCVPSTWWWSSHDPGLGPIIGDGSETAGR